MRIVQADGTMEPPAETQLIRFLVRRDWIRASAVVGAVLVDSVIIVIAAWIATELRWGSHVSGSAYSLVGLILPPFVLVGLLVHAYALDTLSSGFRTVSRVLLALVAAAAIAFATAFALQVSGRISRLETGFMLASAAVLLSIGRVIGWRLMLRLSSAIEPLVFVIGDDSANAHAADVEEIINVRQRGWRPVAQPDFLALVARTLMHADRVLVIFDNEDERNEWGAFMRLTGVDAEVFEPRLAAMSPVGIGTWAGSATLVVSRGPLSLLERAAKRSFDLVLTVLAAPVALPLIAVLAILVRLESKGPAFFVQERVGRQNGTYHCYKLRTMRAALSDSTGTRSASRNDDRVTRLGGFLRRTSLDELPQLWNVFLGEMSLVGPRPHPVGATAEGALFWDIVQTYWTRHAVKPGITGLAQVRGLRGATESRGHLEARVAADLEYINTWSLWLDVRILVQTLRVIVHRNAF